MRYFSVKNFDKFQHYKSPRDDAHPVWIKLYRSLLDDFEFLDLPDESKAHLMLIWILASQKGNRLPYDQRQIGKRIGATKQVDLERLVQAGFIVLERSDESALERSEESSLERTAELASISLSSSESESSSLSKSSCEPRKRETPWPDDLSLDDEKRQIAGELGVNSELEFAKWRDWCAAHPRKARYGNWTAAWRNWCRNAQAFSGARASPSNGKAETPIEMAKRRLREAQERDRTGSERNHSVANGSVPQLEAQRGDDGALRIRSPAG